MEAGSDGNRSWTVLQKPTVPPNAPIPGRQFVTIMLNADDEEYIDVELLYTAPNPVLDGIPGMNTLFRRHRTANPS